MNVLCVRATCVVVARAPTCSLRKKGGTTLDIGDVAASYSSIVRYSCNTPTRTITPIKPCAWLFASSGGSIVRTHVNLALGSSPLRKVQQ